MIFGFKLNTEDVKACQMLTATIGVCVSTYHVFVCAPFYHMLYPFSKHWVFQNLFLYVYPNSQDKKLDVIDFSIFRILLLSWFPQFHRWILYAFLVVCNQITYVVWNYIPNLIKIINTKIKPSLSKVLGNAILSAFSRIPKICHVFPVVLI